jgi:hypothetical protein
MSHDLSTTSPYRKVSISTWADRKVRNLSRLQASGQAMFVMLLIGPQTTNIPGVQPVGRMAFAEMLEWEMEAFDQAFGEAFAQGLVKADWKARLVFVPKAIQHNLPQSPNVVKSWASTWARVPDCELKREAWATLYEALSALGESFANAFKAACPLDLEPSSLPSSVPSEKASGKPSPKPSRKATDNQEQEQEQKQEQKQEKKKAAAGMSDPAAASPPAPPSPSPTDAAADAPTEPPPAGRQRRGSRLPDGWVLPKSWGDWALGERPEMGAEEVRKVADCFADYWHAKAGKDACKTDWEAAWRLWVRREPLRPPGKRALPTAAAGGAVSSANQAAGAEWLRTLQGEAKEAGGGYAGS